MRTSMSTSLDGYSDSATFLLREPVTQESVSGAFFGLRTEMAGMATIEAVPLPHALEYLTAAWHAVSGDALHVDPAVTTSHVLGTGLRAPAVLVRYFFDGLGAVGLALRADHKQRAGDVIVQATGPDSVTIMQQDRWLPLGQLLPGFTVPVVHVNPW